MSMPGIALIAAAAASALAPQKPYAECVQDPEKYLAMSFQEFDQGVQPVPDGPRLEWGWREITKQEGCHIAAANLIAQWRERHGASLPPFQRSFSAFHEGQLRADGGDYSGAIPLIEEGRVAFSDAAGQAYVDAIVAFLRSDRDALVAARDRLLAVPEPPNWPALQRAFKEQAGQDMKWPLNIEATEALVRCFGKPYSTLGECAG
jgi:hypothetical protein